MVRTAQPQQAIRSGLHDSLLARLATSLQTQHRRLGGTLLRVGKVGKVGKVGSVGRGEVASAPASHELVTSTLMGTSAFSIRSTLL